ncbi:MAG: ATPase, T2SS/T4P/T4SS family [Desulfopila sp.]|nr:ATPase, T2SS/T4P/T4SS family [Desulfopila sp.]
MTTITAAETPSTLPKVTATGDLSEPLYGLLCRAVEERATDIHLDPVANGKRVRFRIDGVMYPQSVLAAEEHKRVLTQVKVAAGFSIDKMYLPKDGTIVFAHQEQGKHYDIRVSLIPAGHGREAIHFRFLTGKAAMTNLEELGMSANHRRQVRAVLESPTGIILIGGITGSGKSSTLYSIASSLDLDRHVGVSIEDPIETYIPGLRQIEVDYEHDLSMAVGLRGLLRMDPDAVFVGEIRDRVSAITTARAGIAGRLVVATLHAPDPATAVEAMNHYEVPRYILSSGLRLIISQHLLRRLCKECAGERDLQADEAELFNEYGVDMPQRVAVPQGCLHCHQYGYLGRIGVFELTSISAALSQDIARDVAKASLLEAFRREGGPAAMVDALEKVGRGIISMDDAKQLYLNTENWRK